MKKIIILFLLSSLYFQSSAQTETAKTTLKPYGSIGVSLGNVDPNDAALDNFSKASYPSIEFGVMGENLSVGAVFGAENFFVSSSTREFYELKTSLSKPVGKCSVYGLLGTGAYFESNFNMFIEYGAGFSYMPNKLGYFVQYSNWARTNYVSTGIVFGF